MNAVAARWAILALNLLLIVAISLATYTFFFTLPKNEMLVTPLDPDEITRLLQAKVEKNIGKTLADYAVIWSVLAPPPPPPPPVQPGEPDNGGPNGGKGGSAQGQSATPLQSLLSSSLKVSLLLYNEAEPEKSRLFLEFTKEAGATDLRQVGQKLAGEKAGKGLEGIRIREVKRLPDPEAAGKFRYEIHFVDKNGQTGILEYAR